MKGEHNVEGVLPPGKNPGAHWIGAWVGPRDGLEALEEGNMFGPCRDSKRKTAIP